MKAATLREIKSALKEVPEDQIMELCLRMAKFKKDNKELLTYLLFEAADEDGYVEGVKRTITEQFDEINRSHYYYMKKGTRKILREVKKNIRYSGRKETEVALLIHFCSEMRGLYPSIQGNTLLMNLYKRQVVAIEKAMDKLHEDLQFDYEAGLEALKTW